MWIGGHLSRCDGYVGLIGCDLSDRDQRQADIAHFLEQAMESRLVADKTMNDGGAGAEVGAGEFATKEFD
jgi:hypothetical protein